MKFVLLHFLLLIGLPVMADDAVTLSREKAIALALLTDSVTQALAPRTDRG